MSVADDAEGVVAAAVAVVGTLLRTTVIGVKAAVAEEAEAIGAITEGGSAGAFGA